MIAKKLRYTNGHFYDLETKERIELNDNIDVTINAEAGNFKNGEKVGKHSDQILSSEQLANAIIVDSNVKECKKVFNNGTILYFRITHSNKKHVFELELLEDLYFYNKVDSKKEDGKLYDCACTVRENTSKTIRMFEHIRGRSLNEVYKNTFVHYFGNNGSPSCNAIDRFYEKSDNEKGSLINRYRKIEQGENIKKN